MSRGAPPATGCCAKTSFQGPTPMAPAVLTAAHSFASRRSAACHVLSVITYLTVPSGIVSASFRTNPACLPSFTASTSSTFVPGRTVRWTSVSTGSLQLSPAATLRPLRKTVIRLSQVAWSHAEREPPGNSLRRK